MVFVSLMLHIANMLRFSLLFFGNAATATSQSHLRLQAVKSRCRQSCSLKSMNNSGLYAFMQLVSLSVSGCGIRLFIKQQLQQHMQHMQHIFCSKPRIVLQRIFAAQFAVRHKFFFILYMNHIAGAYICQFFIIFLKTCIFYIFLCCSFSNASLFVLLVCVFLQQCFVKNK